MKTPLLSIVFFVLASIIGAVGQFFYKDKNAFHHFWPLTSPMKLFPRNEGPQPMFPTPFLARPFTTDPNHLLGILIMGCALLAVMVYYWFIKK